ncbi:MAG: pyridoxal-phosphate dependent enzyme [Cyclobacteriaceae bacterium]
MVTLRSIPDITLYIFACFNNELMFDKSIQSPVQEIKLQEPLAGELKLAVLREDLLHPEVSGNKWRKLKYNFIEMTEKGYDRLVTFGGAYSNHIAATAACARVHGFESVGIIRGEELNAEANHTLRFAHTCGMQLIFVTRAAYRNKNQPQFLKDYLPDDQSYYLIPEGGTNEMAIRGTSEILGSHTSGFDIVCVAAGTGGTAAGIINSLTAHQKALVFPALKGSFMKENIAALIDPEKQYGKDWELIDKYHFGGYAKWNVDLIDFINTFKEQHNIPLDYIYNGKMMYGLYELLKIHYFRSKTSLLAIHTGGIQSTIGFNESNGFLIK